MQSNDISKIYETVMSIPGMNEQIKLTIKIPRKTVLLLTQIIEKGILSKELQEPGSFLHAAGKDGLSNLQTVIDDLLEKSGLKEMKEKLSAFQTK
jgi:hypothetical protein